MVTDEQVNAAWDAWNKGSHASDKAALRAALEAADAAGVKYQAKHIKHGTTYDVIGEGRIRAEKPLADYDRVVVYRCHEDGRLWIRRYSEFIDGCFEIIDNLPESPK